MLKLILALCYALAFAGTLWGTELGQPLLWENRASVASLPATESPSGYEGLRLTRPEEGLHGLLPQKRECWTRFSFRYQLLPEEKPRNLRFLSFNYSFKKQKEQPRSFFDFRLNRRSQACELEMVIRPSSDTLSWITKRTPIQENAFHTLETYIAFIGEDSIVLHAFVNGAPLFSARMGHYSGHQYFDISVNGHGLMQGEQLDMDGPFVADKRLYGAPPTPRHCRSTPIARQVVLACDSFHSFYQGETWKATRWQLWQDGDSAFPLMDVVETDPSFAFQRPVPFPLHKQAYRWTVQFKNNFGHWSPSAPPLLLATKDSSSLLRMVSLHLVPEEGKAATQTLIPGVPYRLFLKIHSPFGWSYLGYFGVQLYHQSYTEGHPGNFGGFLDSTRNFVINGSNNYSNGKGEPLAFYERNLIHGRSHKLNDSTTKSIFLLHRLSLWSRVDTASGEVVCSFALPPSAQPGVWRLRAWAYDSSGGMSSVWAVPISVEAPSPSKKVLWLFLAAATVACALLILMLYRYKKRGKPNTKKEDKEYQALLKYLSSHLKEELSVDKVRNDLRFSVHQFHAILRRNESESLPKLLNRLRIERAKELLKSAERNISEVGFEVGFVEARYFTKVFKDQTGLSPSEYKKGFENASF